MIYNGYLAGIFNFPKILYIFRNYNSMQYNQYIQQKDSYMLVNTYF